MSLRQNAVSLMEIFLSLASVHTNDILDGMKKSYFNADSLLQEAVILKSNNKFARAYTLCQLAMEELAKIPLLFSLWINRINKDPIDYTRLNTIFKDHPKKTKLSIEIEIEFLKLYKQYSDENDLDEGIKSDKKFLTNETELNKLKNESLYVSIKNSSFQSPSNIITEEMLNNIYDASFYKLIMFNNIITNSEFNIDRIAKLIKEKQNN